MRSRPLPCGVITGFRAGRGATCQSSARNVHFVRRSNGRYALHLLFHSVIIIHKHTFTSLHFQSRFLPLNRQPGVVRRVPQPKQTHGRNGMALSAAQP